MPIHHLNCGDLHPLSRLLSEGRGSPFRRAHLVCHCLLIDTGDGVILVDTGLGEAQTQDPRSTLGLDVAFLLKPSTATEFTAVSQVQAHGFDIGDVRDIFMTHLDVDHRGGLTDFPNATVHVNRTELVTAQRPRTLMDARRYRGEWFKDVRWAAHDTGAELWQGFSVLYERDTPAGRIIMVDLPGHSPGHSGVVIEHGGTKTTPVHSLFHVGDAIQHRAELRADSLTPWGIRGFNTLMQASRRHRLRTLQQLQDLDRTAWAAVDIICSHDPAMLDKHLGES
ncbi:MBL fold metallo-hydrolase [Gordonia sp. CPCC 205333]|uniref:MBL fold metallo-hydrolase n=1 Tax=Gordonia sp. CPCC 205333 TaxID=3140790 RepID=UPI003AF35823